MKDARPVAGPTQPGGCDTYLEYDHVSTLTRAADRLLAAPGICLAHGPGLDRAWRDTQCVDHLCERPHLPAPGSVIQHARVDCLVHHAVGAVWHEPTVHTRGWHSVGSAGEDYCCMK